MSAATTILKLAFSKAFVGQRPAYEMGAWLLTLKDLPIESLLSEIERAIDARLHYLAIMMALTVPDICGAMLSENGRATGGGYKKWFKDNLQSEFRFLTPGDCYSLRCGVLHQGRMGIPGSDFARVIFTIPGGVTLHNNIMNDCLQFDAKRFCNTIIAAARQWAFVAAQSDPVKTHMESMIQFRPSGMKPYVWGVPVIG